MNNLNKIARNTLGLILLFYGFNHFFGNFLQISHSEQSIAFFENMGLWLKFVKALEVLAGIALLSNRFVGMALLVLAPISINILAFHFVADIKGILPGALTAVLTAYLVSQYFELFKPFLNPAGGNKQ